MGVTVHLCLHYKVIGQDYRWKYIDENFPDLSRIPDIFICQIFFSGYGHHHISGSLNFIKNICQILFVRPFSSMKYE